MDSLHELYHVAEDAQLATGDYYTCVPPGMLTADASYSLTGKQQSLPGELLTPQQGNSPIPSFLPGTVIPSMKEPHLQTPLEVISPFVMAKQPCHIPKHSPAYATPTPSLPFKPMGTVGQYPIPEHLLQHLLPAHNPNLQPNLTVKPYSLPPIPPYNEELETLILSLMPEVITPVEQLELTIPLYHGTAFTIPKPSSNKLSLIINLADWNASQLYKPPKFKLPSIYSMRQKLFNLHLQKQPVYFSKWDLSNFYWSVKADLAFRFPLPRADGTTTICQLDCLPFGWDKSPWLGQQLHINLVDAVLADAIQHSIYIDDGLAMGPAPQPLEDHVTEVLSTLSTAGFVISPKSEPDATPTKTFIGKCYSATSIYNTKDRLAKLLLTMVTISNAKYISPTFLEKLLGSMVYATCHTSSYACLSTLRAMVHCHQYSAPSYKLNSSLAAALAVAMVPWKFQGFYLHPTPLYEKMYLDGSIYHTGIVCKIQGTWRCQSFPLPAYIQKLPIPVRQQAAELYVILQGQKLMIHYKLQHHLFILDSTSALFTVIKGSSSLSWHRCKILQKIQYYTNKYFLGVQVAQLASEFHPADVPSRVYMPTLQPVTEEIQHKLHYVTTHPALINYDPYVPAIDPDLSPDAWHTPDWIRDVVLTSSYPPTMDLYADQSNALCLLHGTKQQPYAPAAIREQIAFYQPPYTELKSTWQSLLPHLSHSPGLWGLVPRSFFYRYVKPSAHHYCMNSLQVNYTHHLYTNPPGASFMSTLFFIPASMHQCQCNHLCF